MKSVWLSPCPRQDRHGGNTRVGSGRHCMQRHPVAATPRNHTTRSGPLAGSAHGHETDRKGRQKPHCSEDREHSSAGKIPRHARWRIPHENDCPDHDRQERGTQPCALPGQCRPLGGQDDRAGHGVDRRHHRHCPCPWGRGVRAALDQRLRRRPQCGAGAL